MKKTRKFTILPNTERVICRFLNISDQMRNKSNLLIPGQLKAGENLLCAQIVEPGETKFKKGQIVYYSEYSASQLMDAMNVIREGGGFTEMKKPENQYIVIAADDIMAYEAEVDPDFEINLKSNMDLTTPAYKTEVPSSILRP